MMELREKLVQLRAVAGERRGLGRPMTQTEVAQALRSELGVSLTQAYLSQLEGGKRVHLSNTSREALARFFQVHPGYLVNDLAESQWPFPALAASAMATVKPDALQDVPGLALAADLGGAIHGARQQHTSKFPASERHDVSMTPMTSLLPAPATPHTQPWIGDPVQGKQVILPGFVTEYPSGGANRAKPTRRTSPLDERALALLSRLRDHPQPERVLVLVEHIAHLPPTALQELEAFVAQFPKDAS